MRVLFVTQYGALAASSRTRVFQYLPYLHQCGVETQVITVLPDRAIAGSQVMVTRNVRRKVPYYAWASWRTLVCGLRAWWCSRGCDLLFIQKVIFPGPVRWLLRRGCPPIVFDFDDAIFTTEVRQGHWLAAWKERRNAQGVPAMLRLAHGAVVENEYTGGVAAQYCEICTITGPIDTGPYGGCQPRLGEAGQDPNEIVLGWIGSATTVEYLDLIREPLRRLARRHPGLRLQVVGAPWEAEGVPVASKPWRLEDEVTDLRGFGIGLMPMPDDVWTRGKGGYKLLQYMAAGLPVVASPVGINQQIVRDGETGFLARDDAEWEDRLEQLIANPDLRLGMGRAGAGQVESIYALGVQQERFLEMLEAVGGQRA